mmetsp:Transcript_13442/g.22265  ORF Transcript_13442/g.22265 Transcript_13442/m.22265 type:complete len:162 (+) Transcript_13442:54-539(+)
MRPTSLLHTMLLSLLLIVALSSSSCHAFEIQTRSSEPIRLFSTVKISTPSPEDAADMGIREWPQQKKSIGGWSESVGDGETLVRYVLDGTGSVTIVDDDNAQTSAVQSGSLVEVTGIAKVEWAVDDSMIILTPGYEEGGLFVGAAAILLLVTVGGAIFAGN